MSRSSVQTVADFRELLPIITVDKKAIFDPHKLPQHLRYEMEHEFLATKTERMIVQPDWSGWILCDGTDSAISLSVPSIERSRILSTVNSLCSQARSTTEYR